MSTKSDAGYVEGSQPLQGSEDTVMVYKFEVWDRALGKNVVAPYRAPADVIRRMKGMADLSSKLLVDKAALDSHGFYSADAESS